MCPTELKWAVSAYSRAQPPDLSFDPPELPELSQVLISQKNHFLSIQISCLSLLQVGIEIPIVLAWPTPATFAVIFNIFSIENRTDSGVADPSQICLDFW